MFYKQNENANFNGKRKYQPKEKENDNSETYCTLLELPGTWWNLQ